MPELSKTPRSSVLKVGKDGRTHLREVTIPQNCGFGKKRGSLALLKSKQGLSHSAHEPASLSGICRVLQLRLPLPEVEDRELLGLQKSRGRLLFGFFEIVHAQCG